MVFNMSAIDVLLIKLGQIHISWTEFIFIRMHAMKLGKSILLAILLLCYGSSGYTATRTINMVSIVTDASQYETVIKKILRIGYQMIYHVKMNIKICQMMNLIKGLMIW